MTMFLEAMLGGKRRLGERTKNREKQKINEIKGKRKGR